MAHWLLKTEPDCYNWDQLVRDKKARWDGVANATALKNIRSMKQGDTAFVYHTGDERAIIGIAQIISDPYPDPKAEDDRIAVVDLKPLKKLDNPVTLDAIKSDPTFAGWELVRISRLGVMPVPAAMWKRIEKLSKGFSNEHRSAAAAR
ncbi:MAG TPA: EVE domain-containing protein [Tepidisphaeraceae bacterium]|nr:EVE domain-containing protein [Tepidisphaeraceae bacterium]